MFFIIRTIYTRNSMKHLIPRVGLLRRKSFINGNCLSLAMGLFLMMGCSKEAVDTSFSQTYLPFEGEPFDLLVADIDQNGRQDLTVVDHVANVGQTFFQTEPRNYLVGPNFAEVGFHPGNLITWPSLPNTYIMSAEGGNSIVAVESKAEEKEWYSSESEKSLLRGGFKIKSVLRDRAPRFATYFRWPGWSESLAVTPYDKDGIILLKNYDPVKGVSDQRRVVWLSDRRPSIRHAHRISQADLDGDGVNELIYVTHVTEEVWMIRYHDNIENIKPELIFRAEKADEMGMPNEAHPVDIDEDGDIDLLVADETLPSKIHVLLNDGRARFTHIDALPYPTADSPDKEGVIELAVGRDHDGHQYIVAEGHETVGIYQIPRQWKIGQDIPVRFIRKLRDNSQSLIMEDIDGDGWLDVAVGIRRGDRSVWLGYGPLWQNFEQWESDNMILGQVNPNQK